MQLGEPDASGRRRPVPVEGSDFFVECDDVILAVGQVSDVDFADADALPVTGSGTLRADPDTLQTAREGVFAGGDVVSGPANVVTAIAHGKQAAASIHQYLRGQPVARRFDVIRPAVDVEPVELTDAEIEQLARPEIPCRPGAIRVRDLLEVEQALCSKAAVLEAKRCLRCDHE
jgi:pyruvate/2-oxoglutarate dehydrogenase complex dihydrolipoamide dehydrogenase (E3) component